MKRLIFLLCFGLTLCAQDATKLGTPWSYGMAALPSSSTSITTHNVLIDYIYLANTSAAVVTVTITDQSTNCNGAACQIFPAVSIAANTVYSVQALGVPAFKGVSWSASTANVVDGWIAGRQ